MTSYSRKQWGARPPRARYKLDPDQVEGVALHWPGMGPGGKRLSGLAEVAPALRGWQKYHQDTMGWSDIAYQVAIDQAGNWYQLRGLRHRSGANGNDDVNRRYGAFLLIVAEGETPTPAMCATVRDRVARFAHIFPKSSVVLGHSDVRPDPTACPGPSIRDLIHRGVFTPKGIK